MNYLGPGVYASIMAAAIAFFLKVITICYLIMPLTACIRAVATRLPDCCR